MIRLGKNVHQRLHNDPFDSVVRWIFCEIISEPHIVISINIKGYCLFSTNSIELTDTYDFAFIAKLCLIIKFTVSSKKPQNTIVIVICWLMVGCLSLLPSATIIVIILMLGKSSSFILSWQKHLSSLPFSSARVINMLFG